MSSFHGHAITVSIFFLMIHAQFVFAQTPRDDRRILQSILDSCPSDSICELPKGSFVLFEPLQIVRSMTVRGAGGKLDSRKGRVTEIRIADDKKIPAFAIEGRESDIAVKLQDIVLNGGGIQAGGEKDPCRGIDDPFDVFFTTLTLQDVSILGNLLADAIRFEGGSLSLKDVKISDTAEGNGLYVANTTGDIVMIDAEFVGNERWGVYVCNMEGSGQIFMNDVSASSNGRGGIAVVGKGSAPNFRTLCMQNTGAAFNFRFGILLFDVAKSLLFNVSTGFTFSEPDGSFGDGLAVSASHEVFLWDVTTVLNNRAGFYALGPTATEDTHLHLVGDVSALNNAVNAAVEGFALFDPHTGQTSITGLCGFTTPITAPPIDSYCEEGLVEVGCGTITVGFGPPDSSP